MISAAGSLSRIATNAPDFGSLEVAGKKEDVHGKRHNYIVDLLQGREHDAKKARRGDFARRRAWRP
jgi:hypothetical protein